MSTEPLDLDPIEQRVNRWTNGHDGADIWQIAEDRADLLAEAKHLRAAIEEFRHAHGSAAMLADNLAATKEERDAFERERDEALAEVEKARRDFARELSATEAKLENLRAALTDLANAVEAHANDGGHRSERHLLRVEENARKVLFGAEVGGVEAVDRRGDA